MGMLNQRDEILAQIDAGTPATGIVVAETTLSLEEQLARFERYGLPIHVAFDFRAGTIHHSGVPYDDVLADRVTHVSPSPKIRRVEGGALASATGLVPEYGLDDEPGGERLEGEDINRLLHSADLSNTAWARGFMPTAPAAATDPLGGATAWVLTDDQPGQFSHVTSTYAIAADAAQHHARVWLKKALSASTAIASVHFNLAGGTPVYAQLHVDPYTGATEGYEAASTVVDRGDWWELIVSTQNNGTNNLAVFYLFPAIKSALGGGDDAAAIGTNTFWNPQCGNLKRSSPIVTAASQVVRAADQVYISLDDLPWDEDEGLLLVCAQTDNEDGGVATAVCGPGSSETSRIVVRHNGAAEGTTFAGVNDGVVQFKLAGGDAVSEAVTTGGAWSPDAVACARDGETPETDTAADTRMLDAVRLYFGSRANTNHLGGWLKWVVYAPGRVSSELLRVLTLTE